MQLNVIAEQSKGNREVSDKTAENAQEIAMILAEMEDGKSLRKACEFAGVAPSVFLRWVDADKELQEQYTRARARLIDFQAEELEEIGDQAAQAESAVAVAGLRLKSDNRKWLLSKLAPKKYGDKLDMNHGVQPDNPLADLFKQLQNTPLRPAHDE
jgi:hypothetical protein